MKKRVNNDIYINWTILRNEIPEDFSDAVNVKLVARIVNSKDLDITDFSGREDNVFYIRIPAGQLNIGTYTLILTYQKPDATIVGGFASHGLDIKNAFEVVRNSEHEDDEGRDITSDAHYAVDGATFIPAITEVEGDISLSWTNNRALPNPDPVILNEGVPEAVLAANNAAILASSKATIADEKATAANNAAALANEKAGYANTQGDFAKTQGELAQTARENIEGDLALKIDKTSITNDLGDSEKLVMSQKGVKNEVQKLQLADTQQSHSIKQIEDTLNSININQEAKITSEGYGTVSLPKNAANGGMSVKLEGLTAEVEGESLSFLPTGRVRSVGKNLFNPYTAVVYQRGGIHTISYTNEKTKIILRSVSGGGIIGYYIPVIQNTTYNIKPFDYQYTSASKKSSLYLASYSQIPTIGDITLNRINEVSLDITTGGQITTGAGSKYLLVALRVNVDSVVGDYIGGIYVGTASIPTTYEPYKETSLYLTAPELRSSGTVKDEIRKGGNGYELVKRVSDLGEVLTEPVITPISYAGLLNSNSNGTVYHEPVIADAGVYDTGIAIQSTDYPISEIEKIIKWENGVEYLLDVADAVIAVDGLSFTHPDLSDGDLVMFTYAYDKESTVGKMTLTHYDSRYVIADTANGKFYKQKIVSTNGVPSIVLEEV